MNPRAAVLGLALAAGGCGRADPAAPPEIFYGQDVCAVCGMIISDERFAAALVLGDSEKRAYDDVGCLLDDAAALGPGTPVVARWVKDYRRRVWLDATEAVYAHSPELHSPMAFGLAAFGSRRAAEALLRQDLPGEIIDFETAVARFEAGELVMPGGG